MLPRFIEPMLCKPGEAFDSDAFLFEIKWDGTRCLCFVDADLPGGFRLVNRRKIDMTDRYPEFEGLATLPSGTILDGEMVVLKNGKPDFALLQSRDHSRAANKIRSLAKTCPAMYIPFDLLYDAGESIMQRPLAERRQRLEALLAAHPVRHVVPSRSVVGAGSEYFRQTTEQGLEGIVAKRLNSQYQPGRRSGAWIKIKKGLELFCVVIGFEPSGTDDFRSLIVAAPNEGVLRGVGKVGTGFDTAMRKRLNAWLWSHLQPAPVVQVKDKGKWVEPRLVCRCSCMELTPGGEMRAPVFHELIKE